MKKLIFYTLGNLLPQVFLAGIFLWLAKVIDKDEFGLIVLLESILQGLLILFAFGMDKGIERLSFHSGNALTSNKLLKTSFFLTIVLGLISVGLFNIVTWAQGISLLKGITVTSLNCIAASAIFGAAFQSLVAYIYVIGNEKLYAGLRAARALSFVLTLYAGYFYLPVIHAYLLSSILSFVLPLLFFLKRDSLPAFGINSNFVVLTQVIPYCGPFVIALASSFILNYLDRFFIVSYIDTSILAEYSIAQRLVALVTLVTGSVCLMIPPRFYKASDERDRLDVLKAIKQSLNFVLLICISTMCLAPLLIQILYGNKFSLASSYIPWLLIGMFFSIAVSNSTVLYLLHDLRSLTNMITGLVAAFISLLINFLMVPVYGIAASITGYIISMSVLYLIQYLLVKKHHAELPDIWLQSIILIVSASLIHYCLYYLQASYNNTLYLLSGAGVIICFFALNLLRKSALVL